MDKKSRKSEARLGGGGSNTNKQLVSRSHDFSLAAKSKATMDISKAYTKRRIEPVAKPDVLSLARQMNPDFGPRVKEIFEPELEATRAALETGIYIGWRCPDQLHDCQRLGIHSRCFCGHDLSQHKSFTGKSVAVACKASCSCKAFSFIPSRPEEVGEFWMRRRPNYEEIVKEWKAKCRCKHSHVDHDPKFRRCRKSGCGCGIFTSNFLCAACDRHWEQHETIFEDEQTRRQLGLPTGEGYFPFAEIETLRNCVVTGEDDGGEFDIAAHAAAAGQKAIDMHQRKAIENSYSPVVCSASRHANSLAGAQFSSPAGSWPGHQGMLTEGSSSSSSSSRSPSTRNHSKNTAAEMDSSKSSRISGFRPVYD